MLIPSLPYVVTGAANQFQPLAVKTLRNGRLKREEIKADRQYPVRSAARRTAGAYV